MEEMLHKIVLQARTIDEKRKNYRQDKEIDETYLKEWRNVRTLLTDEHLEEMLKIKNMTRDELSFSLQTGEGYEYLDEDQWIDEFSKILEKFPYDTIDYSVGVVVPTLPMLYFLKEQLNDFIMGLSSISVEDVIITSFLEAAQEEMFSIVGKLIALELEVYKSSSAFKSEKSEEKFREFIESKFHSQESFFEFYKKYPVAARVVTIRIGYFSENCRLLFERINRDKESISNFLDVKVEKLILSAIKLSTGDSHQKGNSVTVLDFKDKKLVYKPRNLEIGIAFQEFIDWCHKKSGLLDLKIPRALYYDSYTYQEFISKEFCRNENDVVKFYTRYGYLVAVCYLLGINDLHLENVIAKGQYPVIVDIETMFQPEIRFEDEILHIKLVKELELNSVANSSLLPKQLGIGIEGYVEMSALNGKETKVDLQFYAPTNVNTAEFHYEKKDAIFAGGENIPMLNESKEVDYQKYLLYIIEGFDTFVSYVMNSKSEIMKAISPFRKKLVRILTKGTEQYASMIRYSDHPNYNSEMKYRERLMMNIWAYPYEDKRLIQSEVRDMIFGDIPIFFAHTDGKDIIDSEGNRYQDYFELSGFDDTVKRINNLNVQEIRKQRTIMISSLGLANFVLNEERTMLQLKDLNLLFDSIREAERVAQWLMQDMITRKQETSFLTLDVDENNHWKVIAADESLYSGLSGVATLFLLLYIKTKKDVYFVHYKTLLAAAINQAIGQPIFSAFSGKLSPLYPLLIEFSMVGTIENEDYVKSVIEEINNLTEIDVRNIPGSDYTTGIAGILKLFDKMKLLLTIGVVSESVVSLFVDVLKERIAKDDQAFNNVGIAHGLSGLALSLSSICKENNGIVEKLLEKEMSLQIAEGNSYKWCWGLSGMIQARIAIIKDKENSKIEKQLNELINQYEKILTFVPKDDTLCHGNGSIITTLQAIYKYTNDQKWEKKMNTLLSNIQQRVIISDYSVPKLFDVKALGLFDGLSGVGFVYLCVTENIPNLLILELE